MNPKILCLLKRRPDLSRTQFKAYYEEKHAPLIARILPFYREFRRNFLVDNQDYRPSHLDNKVEYDPGFDVVTESTFDSQQEYEKLVATLSDPGTSTVIREDEDNFLDRSKMTVYIVEECKTV